MDRFQIGDEVRHTVTFKNLAGVLADPAVVVFKAQTPAGVITTLAFIHPSTGVYYADRVLTDDGINYWRWQGTGGGVTAADEGGYSVESSRF